MDNFINNKRLMDTILAILTAIVLFAILTGCGRRVRSGRGNNTNLDINSPQTTNTTFSAEHYYTMCSRNAVNTNCLNRISPRFISYRYFYHRGCYASYRSCLSIGGL